MVSDFDADWPLWSVTVTVNAGAGADGVAVIWPDVRFSVSPAGSGYRCGVRRGNHAVRKRGRSDGQSRGIDIDGERLRRGLATLVRHCDGKRGCGRGWRPRNLA